MPAAFAMVRVRFTPVGARAFLPAIAIAMATNSTLSVCAEERARRTATKTVSVTAKTHASAPSMPVAFATVRAQCTLVDARTFLREIAIATEMNSMRLGCAEGPARLTSMAMVFAIQTRFSDAQTQMPVTSIQPRIRTTVLASMWMHSACAEVHARQIPTTTVFATTRMLV